MLFTILPFLLRPINIVWMWQQNTNSKTRYLSFPIAGSQWQTWQNSLEFSLFQGRSLYLVLPLSLCLGCLLLDWNQTQRLEGKAWKPLHMVSKINLCSVYPLVFVCFVGISVVCSSMYSQQRDGDLESLSNVSKMVRLLTGRSIFNTKFIWSKLHILFTTLHFLLQVPKARIQCFFISVSILHHEYFTFHQINLKTK